MGACDPWLKDDNEMIRSRRIAMGLTVALCLAVAQFGIEIPTHTIPSAAPGTLETQPRNPNRAEADVRRPSTHDLADLSLLPYDARLRSTGSVLASMSERH